MGSRARAQAASQCAERVKGVDRSEGNPLVEGEVLSTGASS